MLNLSVGPVLGGLYVLSVSNFSWLKLMKIGYNYPYF
jgi:hypothetical protein